MKKVFLVIFVLSFFLGCEKEITQEDCRKEGKKLQVKKVLNFRSGEYEIKKECIN